MIDSSRRRPRRNDVLLGLALVVLAVCLLGNRLGFQLRTVESGSMAPHVGVGALVVERQEPVQSVRVGQVITYRAPVAQGPVVTHRVSAVTRDATGMTTIRTRGDANPGEDPWEAAIGEPRVWREIAVVPHVGGLLSSIRSGAQTPVGLLAGVAVAMFVIWMPSRTRATVRWAA